MFANLCQSQRTPPYAAPAASERVPPVVCPRSTAQAAKHSSQAAASSLSVQQHALSSPAVPRLHTQPTVCALPAQHVHQRALDACALVRGVVPIIPLRQAQAKGSSQVSTFLRQATQHATNDKIRYGATSTRLVLWLQQERSRTPAVQGQTTHQELDALHSIPRLECRPGVCCIVGIESQPAGSGGKRSRSQPLMCMHL